MPAREIKFRACRIDNKELVYGWYVFCRGRHYILEAYNENGYDERWETKDWIEIDPDTLGQYIDLKDKNSKEIYQHDITTNGQDHCLIVWRKDLASFALSKHGWMYDHYFGEAVDPHLVEVVGNRHQNPELLIGKELGDA